MKIYKLVSARAKHLFKLDETVSLLGGAAQICDHLQGGVQVETSETVSQVEQVNPALTLKVIDVESELGAFRKKTKDYIYQSFYLTLKNI